MFCDRFATRLIAVCLLIASAPALALAQATPPDLEQAFIDELRPAYPALLKASGAALKPGSPAFEEALAATASAFLAARPDDCAVEDWLEAGCGARPLRTPSQAMAPALVVGDTFLSVEATPSRPLQRGDVVAFRDPRRPEARNATIYVSRLIGLPGERIRLRDGLIEIDGLTVAREATGRTADLDDGLSARSLFIERLPNGRTYTILRPVELPSASPTLQTQENMPEVTVPEGRYFMLGDNRFNAMDSRFAASGEGPGMPATRDIVGWAKTVYAAKDTKRIGRRP